MVQADADPPDDITAPFIGNDPSPFDRCQVRDAMAGQGKPGRSRECGIGLAAYAGRAKTKDMRATMPNPRGAPTGNQGQNLRVAQGTIEEDAHRAWAECRYCSSARQDSGRWIIAVVPFPNSLSRAKVPPCSAARAETSGRPSPVPS